jgi:soluble cytochrome b562
MWTSAARLAELVASYRRAPQRPEKTRKGRTLPEADFEFRGGFAQLIGRVDRAHPHW